MLVACPESSVSQKERNNKWNDTVASLCCVSTGSNPLILIQLLDRVES